jgi:hypothetical protein
VFDFSSLLGLDSASSSSPSSTFFGLPLPFLFLQQLVGQQQQIMAMIKAVVVVVNEKREKVKEKKWMIIVEKRM